MISMLEEEKYQSSNIKVFVRVRPLLAHEKGKVSLLEVEVGV